MKVLHLSFHKGCMEDIEYVASKLNFEVESVRFSDGESPDGVIYNINHDRAEKAWDLYKDFYKSFDLIITSDTAPISRVFLQHNFKGRVIIWVCNRFDYYDSATSDGSFPDEEYYNYFRNLPDNYKVFSYTSFEYIYAREHRNVDFGDKCIKPIGVRDNILKTSSIPAEIKKSETFFMPYYINDGIYENKVRELGINLFKGRYNGANDLKDFKAIIHIPYAWSNLSLFENLQNEMIYFIPSIKFLLQLAEHKEFYWTPPFDIPHLKDCEWYLPEHEELFVYFDTWDDLKEKLFNTDYDEIKSKIRRFNVRHKQENLSKWKDAIFN